MATSGTVAALHAREFWGNGQHVDISKQESTFGLNRLMFTPAESEGQVVDRARRYVYTEASSPVLTATSCSTPGKTANGKHWWE